MTNQAAPHHLPEFIVTLQAPQGMVFRKVINTPRSACGSASQPARTSSTHGSAGKRLLDSGQWRSDHFWENKSPW